MKRILLFFWFALVFGSCVENGEQQRTEDNLVQNLTSGTWRISFLKLDDLDKTNDFEGVTFTFLPDGKVEAFRGTQLLDQGSWSTSVDSGRIEIKISFTLRTMFEDLNGDWFQISVTDNRVSLESTDSERADILIFTNR